MKPQVESDWGKFLPIIRECFESAAVATSFFVGAAVLFHVPRYSFNCIWLIVAEVSLLYYAGVAVLAVALTTAARSLRALKVNRWVLVPFCLAFAVLTAQVVQALSVVAIKGALSSLGF